MEVSPVVEALIWVRNYMAGTDFDGTVAVGANVAFLREGGANLHPIDLGPRGSDNRIAKAS